MTGFNEKLYEELSKLTCNGTALPVFLQGHVPNGTEFPYITYTPRQGEGLTNATQTFFAFFKIKSGVNAFQQRVDFIGKVCEAFPKKGIVLNYDNGCVALYRSGVQWIRFHDDPTDKSVIGVRMALDIHYYE